LGTAKGARRWFWQPSRTTWLLMGIPLALVVGAVAGFLVASEDRDPLPPGELVILSGRDDSTDKQRKALIDQWNELHPDNWAELVELSEIADDQHSEMVARAQSGGGGVDVYNLDVTWIAEFAEAGYIRPLDESGLDTSGFLPNPLRTCRYDGKLWALPFNTDAGLLYYRTDLVPAPVSWSQLQETIADTLARGAGEPGIAGYAGQLAQYEGLTVNALEAIQSVTGDSEVVEDGKVVVDLDDMQKAVNRLRPTNGDPEFVLPQSLDFREQETTRAFRERRVVFMRNWPVAHRALAVQGGPEGTTGPPVDFDVTTLPGPSVLGGQNLAIAKSSRNPEAAQALIEFLTDARSQQILFERGGLAATRQVVYTDARVRENYPYAKTLLRAIQRAYPRPVTPCYTKFSETFRLAVNEALRSNEPLPDDFIERLESVLRDC
jgi:multiple sugar transport system substrate-binding protein